MKDNIYKLKKTVSYIKHYGPVKLARKAAGKIIERDGYPARWAELETAEEELFMQRGAWFSYMPRISILVPVYNPKKEHLREMLLSVLDQTYFNWQLCIVDASDRKMEEYIEKITGNDTRVRYYATENGGIAANTNTALAMATGDYVALLDNDDTLSIDALYRMVEMINKENPDCLYSDEDKIDETGEKHFCPNIKPDYDPVLLRTNNYICHLFMARLDLARDVGGFDGGYDGAQDYDFILRCTENSGRVSHVPRILYHWRIHENSTSGNPLSKTYAYTAGKRAIEEHLKRIGRNGNVSMLDDMGFYRVEYGLYGKKEKDEITAGVPNVKNKIDGNLPDIKIVVCGVSDNDKAQNYFKYIRTSTDYEQYTMCAMKEPDEGRLAEQQCEYFLFIKEGTQFYDRQWLAKLLSFCVAEQADGAAARVIAGRTLIYGGADYKDAFGNKKTLAGKPFWYKGYFNRSILQGSVNAIPKTGILVKKQAYMDYVADAAGGLAAYIKKGKSRRFVYEPNVVLCEKNTKAMSGLL